MPKYGQQLTRSRKATLFQNNKLARSGFGDENALYNRVHAKEQHDSRPNLILNFTLFCRTGRFLRLG